MKIYCLFFEEFVKESFVLISLKWDKSVFHIIVLSNNKVYFFTTECEIQRSQKLVKLHYKLFSISEN